MQQLIVFSTFYSKGQLPKLSNIKINGIALESFDPDNFLQRCTKKIDSP
jgi:hypothetical protein